MRRYRERISLTRKIKRARPMKRELKQSLERELKIEFKNSKVALRQRAAK